ncbi:LysM peptidoglycan-binding domain-containing protein [Photobacterium kagoshimensis]|uniref:LysM peptidoglycan-binding domain-containing protein n=1 Tax=Photobacterium kagoshimensis TaxID=2910242 RepID=UPI003D1508B7
MKNTYIIQKGDTLSELALKFNTSVSNLQSLNSQQIKNIDSIFDGNTIVTSKLPDHKVDKRDASPELNDKYLSSALCEAKEKLIVDALYIPEHPNSGKSEYLLLTEEGKKCVLQESKLCRDANIGDKETRLKNFSKLGILDKYNSVVHERFLERGDKINYKRALLKEKWLEMVIYQELLDIPFNDESIGIIDANENTKSINAKHKIDLSKIEQEFGDKDTKFVATYNGAIIANKREQILRANTKNKNKIINLQQIIKRQIAEKIKEFENKAKTNATKIFIGNSDDTYQFSSAGGYYTSKRQLNVEKSLSKLLKYKNKVGLNIELDESGLNHESKIIDLYKANKFYSKWKDRIHPNATSLLSKNVGIRFTLLLKSSGIKSHEAKFIECLKNINSNGFVLLEQILNEKELFSGHKEVEQFRDIALKENSTISILLEFLEKMVHSNEIQLGYYSIYALRLIILKTIVIRIKEFSTIIEKNQDYIQHIRKIFLYVSILDEDIKNIKKTIELKKESPLLEYAIHNYSPSYNGVIQQKLPNNVILNLKSWLPINLNNNILPDSGNNDISIVECSLASDCLSRLFIRSNCPILSDNKSKNKGCSKKYEVPSAGGATGDGRIASDSAQLVNKIKNNNEVKYYEFKFAENSAYIGPDNIPENTLFPWTKDEFDLFGVKGQYETNGGAQFFRFVSEGSVAADNDLFGPSTASLRVKADYKTGVNLATATQELKLTFPDKEKSEFMVPYLKRKPDGSFEKAEVSLGLFTFVFTGKIYGAIAASVHLSSELTINDRRDGKLGVRGSDSIDTSFTEVIARNQTMNRKELRSGFATHTKTFAGIEVGGCLEAAFNWQKDENTAATNIIKAGAGVRATMGVGCELFFKIAVHNRKLIFIFNLGLTKGVGLGGKISTEVNFDAIDDLFIALMELMSRDDFHRFAFFDEEEVDGISSFSLFNTIIAISISFGFTFAEVAKMPYNMLLELDRESMRERNSHLIAEFINKEEYKKNKAWIKNMPAETLSKLLTSLIVYQEPNMWKLGKRDIEEVRISADKNNSQRNAILLILREILHGKRESGIRKFENAVQRMNSNKNLDSNEKWTFYKINLIELHLFFLRGKEENYNSFDNPNERDLYLRQAKSCFGRFLSLLEIGTTKMTLFYIPSRTRGYSKQSIIDYVTLNREDYIKVSHAYKLGYKEIDWGTHDLLL